MSKKSNQSNSLIEYITVTTPPSSSRPQEHLTHDKPVQCLQILQHLCWLIFGGGFIMLLLWYLFSIIATILLIPSPYSIQLLKISPILLTPSTRYPSSTVSSHNYKCSKYLWIVPFGVILCTFHGIFFIIFAPFQCCGINFAMYHWLCLNVVLNPKKYLIINTNVNKFNFYSNSYDIIQNKQQLTKKVCIITGCNTGIGKETAKQLYASGCIVIMACRNQTKADNARNDIIQEFPHMNEQNIFNIHLDLADLKTIDKFVKNFNENPIVNDKLHYLINNAGVMAFPEFGVTIDGLGRQFGVNHMGHFYLVNKLLPCLKRNQTRIINVSSCLHSVFCDTKDMNAWINKDWKGPNPDLVPYSMGGYKYYSMSKLCNLLFTRQLNKVYHSDGIVAVCVHPGVIPQTELNRNGIPNCKELCNFSLKVYPIWDTCRLKTVAQGAATTLRCVIISNEEIFGNVDSRALYFQDCMARNDKIHREFVNGQNMEIDQALWDYSCKIIQSLEYLELNE